MYVQLTATVDHIRLGPSAPCGLITAIMDDLGAELVGAGQAVELTLEQYHERVGLPRPKNTEVCHSHESN